jgi:hypothetical protein
MGICIEPFNIMRKSHEKVGFMIYRDYIILDQPEPSYLLMSKGKLLSEIYK